MIEKIDIHCHIIPGIDDGADNFAQAQAMLEIAVENQITGIIATPHYYRGYIETDKKSVLQQFETLRHMVEERGLQIQLYLGNEIYYNSSIFELLEKQMIFTMAGSRYVLLEFSPGIAYRDILEAVKNTVYRGYFPIIAHAERYQCLLKHIERIEELIKNTAYMQVNAVSVMGGYGGTVKRFLKKLLQAQLVHFIATDAHSDRRRSPRVDRCEEYVEKHFGKEYTKKIFYKNPMHIIGNTYI